MKLILTSFILAFVTGCTVGSAEVAYQTCGPRTLLASIPLIILFSALAGYLAAQFFKEKS